MATIIIVTSSSFPSYIVLLIGREKSSQHSHTSQTKTLIVESVENKMCIFLDFCKNDVGLQNVGLRVTISQHNKAWRKR